jgi:hypothetical protein
MVSVDSTPVTSASQAPCTRDDVTERQRVVAVGVGVRWPGGGVVGAGAVVGGRAVVGAAVGGSVVGAALDGAALVGADVRNVGDGDTLAEADAEGDGDPDGAARAPTCGRTSASATAATSAIAPERNSPEPASVSLQPAGRAREAMGRV